MPNKYYKAKIDRHGGNINISNVATNLSGSPVWSLNSIGLSLPVFACAVGIGEENIQCSTDNQNGTGATISGFRLPGNNNYVNFRLHDASGNEIIDNVTFYVSIELTI